MGRAVERLGDLVSERQYEGAAFLYRGVPRSFKLLLLLFVVLYGGYWVAILLGASPVASALFLGLGFLMAVALAITLVKLWPRMEHALPRWFQAEVEAPALHPYFRYLTWLGMALLVFAAGLYTRELVYAVIIFMGIVGGVLILFLAETYCLNLVDRVKRRRLRHWMEGGWASLLLIFAGFFLALVALVFYGTYTIDGTGPTKSIAFLLLALVFSFIMVVQVVVFTLFVGAMTYRAWMRGRMTKGRAYFGRRRALLNVKPLHLVIYLELMNLITGVYIALYIFLVAIQGAAMTAEAGGVDLLPSLGLIDGALLDYVAWGSIIIAWGIILVNLSSSAVKSEKWYINRNNFAAATVVIVMALLLQMITTQGDESMVSLIFRIFYMVGIMLSPLLVFWNRWKKQAALFPDTADRGEPEGEQLTWLERRRRVA